jgi:hypothetical protein
MSGFKPFDPNGGGFNPTTGISIERLLDAESSSAAQDPTGLGVANEKQVNFGDAVNTGGDPVMLSAAGVLTFNESGLYRIKLSLQFGRSGASGTSELLFKADVGGVQAGRSIFAKLSNASEEQYIENDSWLQLPATTEITYFVMRDANGNDSGGLIGITPTVDGGNEWNDAPSASIRVERWI